MYNTAVGEKIEGGTFTIEERLGQFAAAGVSMVVDTLTIQTVVSVGNWGISKGLKGIVTNTGDDAARGVVKSGGDEVARGIVNGSADVGKDGFESFKEFKKIYGSAGKGKAWHHIVEQNPTNIKMFGPKAIHSIKNMIKLPHGAGSIHAKVSGYYSSTYLNSGMRVRDYASTLSFQDQYKFGIEILKRFGY